MTANICNPEYKENTRGKEYLIAYSSIKGSAAECADRISRKLRGDVKLTNLKKCTLHPASYGKIILGSSIYAGSVQKEVKRFCEEYKDILLSKPLGIYFACLTEKEEDLKEYLKKNFSADIVNHLSAFSGLGGAFYFTRLNFIERKMNLMILKNMAQAEGASAPSDGKTDYITISDERIDRFCRRMEQATQVME